MVDFQSILTVQSGRALDWQSRGQRFDPAYLHQAPQSLAITTIAGLVYFIKACITIFNETVAKVYRYWYTFVIMNYNTIYEHAADNFGLITSSEARTLGIPNVELVKLAHRGRLQRLGHGVYRIIHYIPTEYDKYAEAIALVGGGAAIYGESVLAMHGLALVNPPVIHVVVRSRVRKKLPPYINIIYLKEDFNRVVYEGIPSQSVLDAILACRYTVMTDRLIEAVSEAERQGLISETEAKIARNKLL